MYARAAAAVLGMDRLTESDWQKLEQDLAELVERGNVSKPSPPKERPATRHPWMDPEKTRNWFNR